jgi:hypothetical protein
MIRETYVRVSRSASLMQAMGMTGISIIDDEVGARLPGRFDSAIPFYASDETRKHSAPRIAERSS